MTTDWTNFAVDLTTVTILMVVGLFLIHANGFESIVWAFLIVMFTRYYRR